MTPVRVVAVLTHPIQYYAAWFRWIHAHERDIDLHVVYAARPTSAQQGTGFARAFRWDIPLTEGYSCRVVREARPGDRFDAAHFYGLNVPDIADAIRDAKPDVVVVFGWYSVTLVRALETARALGVPVLYHGDTNLQSAPDGWRRLPWLVKTRRLLARFDGFLSVGVRSAAFLRFFGVSDDRIFATPHAVDNDRFGQALALRRSESRIDLRRALGLPEHDFVVLFCGKLEAKKRPFDLIAGIATLNPRPHVAIVGTGALESQIRSAAAEADVPLTVIGFVNQSEMPRAYAAADCLVLPSDTKETWGLVVNEALAAGLPCVVADSAGCAPDLGSLETGGTYATCDPVEIPRLIGERVERIRERIAAGHDFSPACVAAAERHSFSVSSAGLVRAARTVVNRPVLQATPLRILSCCGSMVLVGGLERMTFEILSTQRERGAALHCIVNWWDNSRIVSLADRLGASWSTGHYLHRFTIHPRSPMALLRMLWDTWLTSAGLLRDAAGFRPSHVFVSDYVTIARNSPALALLRLSGRTVVLRLGNAPEQGAAYKLIWKFAVNPCVDRIICNSPFTQRELARCGIPRRKVMTIAHAAPVRDAPMPSIRRDPRRLIYIGQIIPEKGLDLLLDAVALLVARGHDIRLDVVGRIDGWIPPAHEPYRASVLARGAREDLRDRVRFLGYREDVPSLLAEASIHCCPSRRTVREGFGIVVIEAKCAGIPSVVLPSGNLPDLISHRQDGWVCGDESAEALAEGIAHFLEPGRLQAAMAAARTSADRFSHERFERAWTDLFAVEPTLDDRGRMVVSVHDGSGAPNNVTTH